MSERCGLAFSGRDAWPPATAGTSACSSSGLPSKEAMSHGLPSIVASVGGPADAVDDSSGIRVHPHYTAASKLPADKISKQRRE
jgi:glycosyltransferase involved in cell wall biosynthesis